MQANDIFHIFGVSYGESNFASGLKPYYDMSGKFSKGWLYFRTVLVQECMSHSLA